MTMFEGLQLATTARAVRGRLVLLNFPLLTLWDRDVTVFGLPLLPVALFAGWAVLIALRGLDRARQVERRSRRHRRRATLPDDDARPG